MNAALWLKLKCRRSHGGEAKGHAALGRTRKKLGAAAALRHSDKVQSKSVAFDEVQSDDSCAVALRLTAGSIWQAQEDRSAIRWQNAAANQCFTSHLLCKAFFFAHRLEGEQRSSDLV